jgi:hypothetical protein
VGLLASSEGGGKMGGEKGGETKDDNDVSVAATALENLLAKISGPEYDLVI